jgi:predicted ATP-grasp superfamily ATP-dependent carboligase
MGVGPVRIPVIATRILYAPRRLVMPEVDEAELTSDPFAVPSIADVPAAGTRIEPGEPVMTVFATGSDTSACRERLNQIERTWHERLGFIAGDDMMDTT